jgi:hypothetical protein
LRGEIVFVIDFQGDFANSGVQNVVFGWFFVDKIVVKGGS